MSATSTTGRAALVAANGRARRPAEPPQGDLSHAEAQRGGERRDFWFGEVPDGWEVKRLASYFSERKVKVSDKDFPPLSVTKNGILPQLENVAKTDDGDNRKLVRKGDFVINSRSDRKGSSGLSEYDGSVSLINLVLKPRGGLFGAYCNYLLKSFSFVEENYRNGRGIVADLWTTRYDEMKMIKVAMPPLPEQKAIVAYLDAETGRIDKAIAAEEKMIALLQERREIVINEAVAPHDGWEVRRLGTIGEFSKGGGISRDDLQESGLPAILYGDIYTKYNHAVVEVKNHISDRTAKGAVSVEYGDILMTGSGETKEDIGKAVAFLGDSSFIGGDVICFRQKDNNSCYLSYALSSEAAKAFRYRESKGEIVVHIYASSLKQLPIPLPPLPEQEAIVERLDRETGKIDRAIEVKRRQIELLRERRQIVIDEVVTGKVKVA